MGKPRFTTESFVVEMWGNPLCAQSSKTGPLIMDKLMKESVKVAWFRIIARYPIYTFCACLGYLHGKFVER